MKVWIGTIINGIVKLFNIRCIGKDQSNDEEDNNQYRKDLKHKDTQELPLIMNW